MKDFQRILIIILVGGGLTTYLYTYHWDKYYPLFGFGIFFLCAAIVFIGWGAVIGFLFNSQKNNNFKLFAFSKQAAIFIVAHLIAFPIFWVSEPLIYKSIVTTINERVVPAWYYDVFDREKPEFEEIIHEKQNIW